MIAVGKENINFRQDVITLKSVRSRLPILITASVILCLIISGLSMVLISSADNSMIEDKIKENKASMQQATAGVQKDITAKCDFIASVANTLSGSEQTLNAVLSHHKQHLRSYAANGGFVDVLIADMEGNAYNADGDLFPIGSRKYYQSAVLGVSGVSERVKSLIDTGTPYAVVYYAPILSDNTVIGVLVGVSPAAIDLSAYTDTASVGAGMYILDKNGSLVMSSHTDSSRSFYDSVKDSKYADGTSSEYRKLETAASESLPESGEKIESAGADEETQEKTESPEPDDDVSAPVLTERESEFYVGDMTNSKGFFSWLTKHDNSGRIFFKKALSQNGWHLIYVRPVTLSDSTVSFMILSRVLLFSIVLIFLVAMVVMLWLQWLSGKKIADLAYKDEITGKANWQKFQVTCNRRLASKSWWRMDYAALQINVNRFSIYNEYYGSKAGDHLLRYIADTLDLMCSAKEMSAHRTGDTFAVMWVYNGKEQLEARINDFFELLHDGPNGQNVSVTVGIYLPGKEEKDIAEAVNLAGLAEQTMEEAKVNTIIWFDEKIKAQITEERELEGLMHMALANDEFKLYLQPKHRVSDGALAGAEALVRWINPEKGFISPGRFIPLFEKNGFVDEVDNHMLEKLCQFQQKRMIDDKPLIPISVNVSRVQLSDPQLAQKICELVDSYRVPHRYIDLELTESACFDDMDVLINTINTLREMGFPVSMDDFGSGYSSLNLLKQLAFDTLKIDGEFFRHVTDPDRAKAVVRSIVDMAKSLNMKTVAEGIETDEQVEFLRTTDCDLIQGYYYSKPISADEFERYMSRNKIREH